MSRMPDKIWLSSTVLVVVLGACALPSFHGVPEEEFSTLNEEFLGEWYESKSNGVLYVSRSEDGHYEAHARFTTEDGEPVEAKFSVAAARIGDEIILDVAVAKAEYERLVKRYGSLLLPSHAFLRPVRHGNVVTLYRLDHGWMEQTAELAATRTGSVPFWTIDPEKVLVALRQAVGTEDAWEEAFELQRHPSDLAPQPQDIRAYVRSDEEAWGGRMGPDLVLERGDEQHMVPSKKGYFWSDVIVAALKTSSEHNLQLLVSLNLYLPYLHRLGHPVLKGVL